MDRNLYAVVMAGGRGERFWPQSRVNHPKQLLRLLGNLTLIEQTVERLKGLLPLENCLVVTNEEYVPAMRSLLRYLPPENIIGEPRGRDTGPCVATATGLVGTKTRVSAAETAMIVMPADHAIKDTVQLHQVLTDAVAAARSHQAFIAIGVPPRYASTGYGYLECGEAVPTGTSTSFLAGRSFREKPDQATAERFLAAGNYRWNSGIFIWTLDSIEKAEQAHAPGLWEVTRCIAEAARENRLTEKLSECYEKTEAISIDYAVMEHVENLLVAESSFDWDDVGSWTALRNQLRPREGNNVVRGLFTGIDVRDCVVVGDSDHLIAAVDVQDLVIVQTDDVTLVCNARSAQRVKELVKLVGSDPKLRKFL